MAAYYNEFDPFAAAWLRELIAAGHIPAGVVDTRSIEDVNPNDLRGFDQCHFFAGIGGWPLALRMAGWDDRRPVWTGSCPCQPFSSAGKGAGFADERHLWPAFHHLIGERRPPIVFGEQVASRDGLAWLDLVQADMETAGYAFGTVDLCAAGVGAPHIRQRLYWVGDAVRTGLEGLGRDGYHGHKPGRLDAQPMRPVAETGGASRVADARHSSGQRGESRATERGFPEVNFANDTVRPGPVNGPWRDADWLMCRDGKWRPVESGTSPLAHGVPARVGRLRGYGNAINVYQAKTFIEAYPT